MWQEPAARAQGWDTLLWTAMPSPFSPRKTFTQYQPDGVSHFHAVIPTVRIWAPLGLLASSGWAAPWLWLWCCFSLFSLLGILKIHCPHFMTETWDSQKETVPISCLVSALTHSFHPMPQNCSNHIPTGFFQLHCSFAFLSQIPSHSSSLMKAFRHQPLQVGLAGDRLYISASTASLSSLLD